MYAGYPGKLLDPAYASPISERVLDSIRLL